MIGEEILEKKPITLVEVKAILAERKKENELSYEQDIALKYAKRFSKLTEKQLKKIKEELKGIKGLSEEIMVKIIDILPDKKEILELLIPKESELKEEDLKKILEITKKYVR